jgi:phosphoglucosamine mutase
MRVGWESFKSVALPTLWRYQALVDGRPRDGKGKVGARRQMSRKFFGTDGIRGRTNQMPMTAAMAQRIGQAAGAHFLRGDHRHRVVIGKDTRLSGYMMETALISGFTSVGMDVVMVGPVPTPAVAMLTHSMRADLGVMISASHNKFVDNGIKLFGPDGYKLSDKDEMAIEALLEQEPRLVPGEQIGRSRRIEDARGRYIHAAKLTFPKNLRLDGLKIVVDCANGAAYQVAPSALWELGADVTAIGVSPNGLNINDGCGSTDPILLKNTVIESGADIGLALDGDADRLIVVDEKGETVDGDQLMALIGSSWNRRGALRGGGLVATVMSNLGLERFLAGEGLALVRTQVGDRYVLETMRAGGYNVGGEQSGHIILSDYATTGDGLVAGLQVLAELAATERPASELLSLFEPLPQTLKSVRFNGAAPLEADAVKAAISEGETRLGASGRLVIRKSGTEPVIRVMAEGEDEALVAEIVETICAAVQAA